MSITFASKSGIRTHFKKLILAHMSWPRPQILLFSPLNQGLNGFFFFFVILGNISITVLEGILLLDFARFLAESLF
jgi:hypothetical protein